MRWLVPLLCLASTLPAVEVSGRMVPDRAMVAESEVPLRGARMLRWKWLVDLYVTALYLPPAATDAVAASPKRLRMEYARAFTREDMVRATEETIGNGRPAEEKTAYAATLVTWNALYPAPAKGDVLTFDHLPDGTLVMALDGRELGRVRDEAFARALFAIWIGDHPVQESLRDVLIGR